MIYQTRYEDSTAFDVDVRLMWVMKLGKILMMAMAMFG